MEDVQEGEEDEDGPQALSKPSLKARSGVPVIDIDDIIADKPQAGISPQKATVLDPKISADFARNRLLLQKLNAQPVESSSVGEQVAPLQCLHDE